MAGMPPRGQPRIPLDQAVVWGFLTSGINLVVVFGLGAVLGVTSAVWAVTSLAFLTASLVAAVLLLAMSRTRWVGASVLVGALVTLGAFTVFAYLLRAASLSTA